MQKAFILLKIDNLFWLAVIEKTVKVMQIPKYAFSRKKTRQEALIRAIIFNAVSIQSFIFTRKITKLQSSPKSAKRRTKKIYHFLKVDPGCYITICGKKIGRLNFAAILYVYIHTCYFSLKYYCEYILCMCFSRSSNNIMT